MKHLVEWLGRHEFVVLLAVLIGSASGPACLSCRTASRARGSVANGLASVPELASSPSGATKNVAADRAWVVIASSVAAKMAVSRFMVILLPCGFA
jgi:hypothetical protein